MSTNLSRRIGATLACMGLSSLALWGCGGGGNGVAAPPPNSTLPPAVAEALSRSTPVNSDLVAANNTVGFDLFGKLAQQDPAKNVFISPTSIALALEIVQNGAKGDTLTAMSQTLHLSGTALADLNAGNAALQASLIHPDPKIALTIANSLWVHQGSTTVDPGFVQTNVSYYGSKVGDLAGAPDNVNAWVTQQTNGRITTILPAGDYSSWVFALINAVYFKADWALPFVTASTADAPFTLRDGSTRTCKLMQQESSYAYYRGANFQMARLPYVSDRMSMLLILPDSGADWNAFLASLTAQNLTSWIAQEVQKPGVIYLPRFQSNYDADLIPTLKALGMTVAFTPQADLSGIAPGVMLTFVRHKTFLNVTEQGTEAAAVTGIGGATSVPSNPFTLRADHPFFCAIRDDKTGALLFLGCILDPTAAAAN